jgi:hypothetical protein
MRHLLRYGLAILLASAALAQAQPGQRGPWVWSVSGGALHQAETDLDADAGGFSVNRAFIAGSVGHAWDRRTSVSLSLGAGSSNYVFDDGSRIEGERPWGRIEDYRISVPIRFTVAAKAGFIVIPSVRSYGESGTSFGDGQTEGLIAGAGWRFSERLTLGPGFGWFSELGGGSTGFPILIVDWQITDRLSLETGRGLAASQGPGLTLSYTLADKWQLSALARYEKLRFALDAAPAGAAYGEDRSTPLLLSVNYTPWPMTSASLFVGAEVGGRLSLEDKRTRVIARSDYDTAPVIGFSFSSRF